MSQQIRRVLVAFGLMAALSLTLPSPSHAAGLRGPGLAGDFTVCLRVWLEGLLPGAATPAPSHRLAVKTGSAARPGQPVAGTPSTASATTDQGAMIDPNGFK
jgi:hypothetical protein